MCMCTGVHHQCSCVSSTGYPGGPDWTQLAVAQPGHRLHAGCPRHARLPHSHPMAALPSHGGDGLGLFVACLCPLASGVIHCS